MDLNVLFAGFASKNPWGQEEVDFSKSDFEDIFPLLGDYLNKHIERAIAAAYVLDEISIDANGTFQEVLTEYRADMLDEDTKKVIDRVNCELVMADIRASAEFAYQNLPDNAGQDELDNIKYSHKRFRSCVIYYAYHEGIIDDDYTVKNIGPQLSFDPKVS